MIEGLILGGLPIAIREGYKRLTKIENPYVNTAIMLLLLYIYALLVLTYRCKFRSDNKKIEFAKSLYALIPFVAYYVAYYVSDYTGPVAKRIIKSNLAFFIVGYFFFLTSLQLSNPDCFETNLLSRILGYFSKAWNFLTGIF
jgi:hypothetical protein